MASARAPLPIPPDDAIERVRRMTPSQRIALCLQLSEVTESIVRGRPDADRLRAPTPLSSESAALWRRLMQRRASR